ncbi:hypothetical protein HYX02_02050 [Candidatus Woesearchaeota archaeon]|nr:hypothetical protein [Candidatus Woesearchaeota archaeon]
MNYNLNKWLKEFSFYKKRIFISLILLVIAAIANFYFSNYTSKVETSTVNDLILNLIPPIDLTPLFILGWWAPFFLIFVFPLFARIHKFHEAVYHFSLLVVVRSIFISLTHLKVPADAIQVSLPKPLNWLYFQNDMFFSGHTAFILIGFFVFKHEKIKYLFLVLSIIMAFTVLAMHQHYSIDVFAAYFITYGTFKIGEWLREKLSKTGIKRYLL